MCKQSKARNSFTTSHRQAEVHPLPWKQGSSYLTLSWEDKCHHSKFAISITYSFFFPVFIANIMLYGTGHPFGQAGSAVLVLSASSSLHSSSSPWKDSARSCVSTDLQWSFSKNNGITTIFHQNYKIQHHRRL